MFFVRSHDRGALSSQIFFFFSPKEDERQRQRDQDNYSDLIEYRIEPRLNTRRIISRYLSFERIIFFLIYCGELYFLQLFILILYYKCLKLYKYKVNGTVICWHKFNNSSIMIRIRRTFRANFKEIWEKMKVLRLSTTQIVPFAITDCALVAELPGNRYRLIRGWMSNPGWRWPYPTGSWCRIRAV